MSRLAKRPIPIPNGVEVEVKDDTLQIKGPKGALKHQMMKGLTIVKEDGVLKIEKDEKLHKNGEMHGLHWALIKNKVAGVSEGFSKELHLIGVGYRAAVQGNKLDLQVGQSHPLQIDIPADLKVEVKKATILTISGIDKQKVGQFAAQVQRANPPEPYKGKGIRYKDQYVRKKAGKAAKAGK